MYSDIYKLICAFDKIVLARHVGVDPDAMASVMALKDSIMLTFKEKKVYAVGSGSNRFSYFGKLDRIEDMKNSLLIVLDTPDIRRIDGVNLSDFSKIIKIDHHPFVEKFADIEWIDDTSSSASELVLELINQTPLLMDKNIASGGFRSKNGGIRFGNIMSIIKTSKLRGINPFDSIKRIMSGESLFA